ncbi:hypothetical protein B296_00016310 [Ensete ventricosum]|uniref:Uncharacterized protein n=1 Tax=Ensete ventricosum TaxID=4639 RepID=A0A427AYC1_ENSVE|nr:hypothetical protein B296_00016310 [Ensete ventricosum]
MKILGRQPSDSLNRSKRMSSKSSLGTLVLNGCRPIRSGYDMVRVRRMRELQQFWSGSMGRDFRFRSGSVKKPGKKRAVRTATTRRRQAMSEMRTPVQEAPSQSRRARLRNHPKNFESLDGHEKKRKMVLILFFAHPHSRTLSFDGWIQRNSPSLPLQISSLPDPFTGSPLMLAGKSR